MTHDRSEHTLHTFISFFHSFLVICVRVFLHLHPFDIHYLDLFLWVKFSVVVLHFHSLLSHFESFKILVFSSLFDLSGFVLFVFFLIETM